MPSRGLLAVVAVLLCLGLGAAFQLRSSPVRLAAVVRSGAAGASIQAMSRGVSGETSPSVADSAALLQSSPVHLEAIAKSDAAWVIIRAMGRGATGDDGTVYDNGINDMTGMSSTKYYAAWIDMLKRCYSDKYLEKYPSYKGCSVCPEWLYLSVFHAWMQAHDGYRDGLELDKDILVFGNKVHSPQTCLFVSHAVNVLLNDRGATRGEWAQGVYFDKPMRKFRAEIRIDGKLKHLGYFDSEDEAEETYLAAKSDNIRRMIDLLPGDPYHEPTRQGLARHADRFSPRSNEVHLKAMATGIARAAASEKRKAARGDLPKGVYLHKPSGKYRAEISIGGGKSKFLGYFATPEEAGEVYRTARLENPAHSRRSPKVPVAPSIADRSAPHFAARTANP
jgi:hypothetical protein